MKRDLNNSILEENIHFKVLINHKNHFIRNSINLVTGKFDRFGRNLGEVINSWVLNSCNTKRILLKS